MVNKNDLPWFNYKMSCLFNLFFVLLDYLISKNSQHEELKNGPVTYEFHTSLSYFHHFHSTWVSSSLFFEQFLVAARILPSLYLLISGSESSSKSHLFFFFFDFIFYFDLSGTSSTCSSSDLFIFCWHSRRQEYIIITTLLFFSNFLFRLLFNLGIALLGPHLMHISFNLTFMLQSKLEAGILFTPRNNFLFSLS